MHKLDMAAVMARKQALADYKKDYQGKPTSTTTLKDRVAVIERILGLRKYTSKAGGN